MRRDSILNRTSIRFHRVDNLEAFEIQAGSSFRGAMTDSEALKIQGASGLENQRLF